MTLEQVTAIQGATFLIQWSLQRLVHERLIIPTTDILDWAIGAFMLMLVIILFKFLRRRLTW